MIEASDKFHQVANGEIRPLDWSTGISFTKESLPYEIEGKTEQTTYTGKNLVDIAGLANVATILNSNNGFKFTKISESSRYSQITNFATPIPANTQIVISYDILAGSTGCFCQWYCSDGTSLWSPNLSVTQTSITTSFAKEVKGFRLYFQSGMTDGIYFEVNNFMIRRSNTTSDFEPYVGGVASPNPSYPQEVRTLTGEQTIEVGGEEYKINLSSRNLFNKDLIPESIGGTNLRSIELQLKPNTTYTTSTSLTRNTAGNADLFVFATGGTAGTSVNGLWDNHHQTTTTLSDGKLIIQYRASGRVITRDDWWYQVEEGSIPSEYTPYFEPTELAKLGDYQDRIFKASGKNLINKEVIARSANLTIAQTNTGLKITKTASSQYNFATLNLPNSSSYYGKRLTLRLNISRSDTAVVPRVAIYWTNDIGSAGSWIANISVDGTTGVKTASFNVPATAPNASYPNVGILLYPDFRDQNGTWSQFDDIQLEEGSTATSYEPYGTDWYIEKQVGKAVLTGTENWSTWGTQISGKLRWALDYSQIIVKPASAQVVGNILSDRYTAITQDLNYAGATTGIAIQTSGWIAINDTARNTDLTAWKTWLGSHYTSIYYALANPTYTKVTGPLLDQLNYIYSQNLDYLNVKNSVLSISTSRSIEFPYTIQTATCDISLDNANGTFNYSRESDFGQYILPNRPVKVGLGFKNAEIVPHFKGNTPSVPTYQGEREEQVTFTANDKLAVIGAKHLPNMIMARDIRTDQVIKRIFDDLNIPASEYVLEEATNIIPFVYFESDKSVANALKELVQAENGSLWQDEEGIIRFQARTTNIFEKDISMVFDKTNIISIVPSHTDSIVNQVNISADIREIKELQPVFTADNASGYQSESAQDNYRVPANGTTNLWLSFEDPVWLAIPPMLNAGSQTSSYSVVNLAGQPVTSGVTITGTLFATSYKVTISNTNSFPVSISSISIWGEPAKLVGGQAVEYMAIDDESVEKFGANTLVVENNKCFGSVENVKRYALDIIEKYADYNAVVKVTAKADPALQLGDVVLLALDNYDGRYVIKGIDTVLNGSGLTTTLTLNLLASGDKTPFILNQSKLNSDNEVLG